MQFLKKWGMLIGMFLVGSFFGTPIKRMWQERSMKPDQKKALDDAYKAFEVLEKAIENNTPFNIYYAQGELSTDTVDQSGT